MHQIDIFNLNTANIVALISLAGGVILLMRGWKHPEYRGIFGGIFFTILGISLFLMQYNYFPASDSFAIYAPILVPTVTFIIFGIIFILIGSPMIAYEFYYISFWEIRDIFSTYWPILLILIGVGLLGEGLLKHFRNKGR